MDKKKRCMTCDATEAVVERLTTIKGEGGTKWASLRIFCVACKKEEWEVWPLKK